MNPNKQALTSVHPSIARVLSNRIFISEAFDPSNTPTPPPFKDYIGIWDTGASNSVITQKIVNDLGLIATGKATVYHAQGQKVDVDTFLVNVGLPNNVIFTGVTVILGELRDADVLIGMDIIAQGDFAVTRKGGGTCHSFQMPSTHTIDFVEEINLENAKRQPILTDDERRKARNKRTAEKRKNR